VTGADLSNAAIGIGLQYFGEYQQVYEFDGTSVPTTEFLEYIRNYVTNFTPTTNKMEIL